MAAKREQPRVFFPWEKRRGVRSLFARARAGQALLVVLGVAAFSGLRSHERRASQVRATRATISTAMSAIAAWRADHDRGCPESLSALVAGGYVYELPRDAWGRPLRVTCPGRTDPRGFD